MKRLIATGTIVSFILGIVCALLYQNSDRGIYFSLSVTFFTSFYHFIMRVVVAYLVVRCRKHKDKSDLVPFKLSRTEHNLYKIIRLKKWKKYVPTYDKTLFSIKDHLGLELIHNMTDAEIGHLIIVFLSFAPMLLSKTLDGFVPFLVTSVLAAAFDAQFVMVQRFNKARVWQIFADKKEKY